MTRTILAAFLLLMVSGGASRAELNGHLSRTVDTLVELRKLARGDALAVFATCAPKSRCGVRYDFYGMLYNRTVNAFAVMINGLVRQIETTGHYNGSAYDRFTIDDAAVQYALLRVAFLKLKASTDPATNVVHSPNLNRIIDETQRNMLASLTALGAASRTSRPDERQAIARALRELKWRRFEDIRPRATAADDGS